MARIETLSVFEHIRKRPEVYLGTSDFSQKLENKFLLIDENIKKEKVQCSEVVIHLFEEVLNNVVDSYLRKEGVTYLNVTIEKKGISIENDFNIKFNIEQSKTMFGEVFSSSNYDDNVKKNWTGRNGVGVKLVNIFSKIFTVEITDSKITRLYTWKGFKFIDEKIIESPHKSSRIKIYFEPDIGQISNYDNEVRVIEKRLLDIKEYLKDIKIVFNNKEIISKDYYYKYSKDIYRIYKDKDFDIYISFTYPHNITLVNSLFISSGSHIKKVKDRLISDLNCEKIKNKIKVLGNFSIQNPSFKSQTKKELDCRNFDLPKFNYTEEFKKKVKNLVAKSYSNKNKVLNHSPALKLGTKNSSLIITEGISAMSMVLSSLESREYYGVYPLKGKILNVYEKEPENIYNNKEISELVKILNVDISKDYEDLSDLNYSSVIIATDQDEDGFHITGLVINFFLKFCPSLLRLGFLKRLNTPLIIAYKKRKEYWFFNKDDLEESKLEPSSIEFNKGLGSIDRVNSKNIFKYLDNFLTNLVSDKDSFLILENMFSKKKTNERKEIFNTVQKKRESRDSVEINEKITLCNPPPREITLSDFFKYEYIVFPKISITRAIPNIFDGFKESQRKIIYTMLKKEGKRKIINIAGDVMKETLYHHGDASLTEAIIKLGQNYTGSNNVCLLETKGHFGTRRELGKDASKPRYIEAGIGKSIRKIFRSEDDILLEYVEEESQKLEPITLFPILPIYFLNGCNGIGFGYKSFLINFKKEIVTFFIECINDYGNHNIQKRFDSSLFGYKNFKGTIVGNDSSGDILFEGVWRFKEGKKFNTLEISEIPPLKSIKSIIKKCYENNITIKDKTIDDNIDILIETKLDEQEIVSLLGLTQSFNYKNILNFIDEEHNIKSFPNIISLIKFYISKRLPLYKKRKELLLKKQEIDINNLEKKIKFMEALENGEADYKKIDDWLIINKYIESSKDDKGVYLTVTVKDVHNLNKFRDKLKKIKLEREKLFNSTPKELWTSELEELYDFLKK